MDDNEELQSLLRTYELKQGNHAQDTNMQR